MIVPAAPPTGSAASPMRRGLKHYGANAALMRRGLKPMVPGSGVPLLGPPALPPPWEGD